jgi:hypothetical protein
MFLTSQYLNNKYSPKNAQQCLYLAYSKRRDHVAFANCFQPMFFRLITAVLAPWAPYWLRDQQLKKPGKTHDKPRQRHMELALLVPVRGRLRNRYSTPRRSCIRPFLLRVTLFFQHKTFQTVLARIKKLNSNEANRIIVGINLKWAWLSTGSMSLCGIPL